MTVVLRPATIHDIPKLMAVAQSAATAAHWTADQYSQLISGGVVLVAESGNRLRGFLCAKAISGEWEIENIVVSAENLRVGIGSQLLQELIAEAEFARASAVLLEVRESNLPARRFYEKHGFLQSGHRPGYYRNPSDAAVLYTLPLPRP